MEGAREGDVTCVDRRMHEKRDRSSVPNKGETTQDLEVCQDTWDKGGKKWYRDYKAPCGEGARQR